MEIPFKPFSILDTYCNTGFPDQIDLIESIGIEGHLAGAFFLDDARLLADTPQITTIEVHSSGQIKTGLSE
ncbi:MAG: hypothetical protein HOL51_11325 [Gemmatimonadetes bacterium]|jgi:hypothetical protein|nr:hypothetical protein [Gemmatimonadota bacterium]